MNQILKFSSSWCKPCEMLNETIKKLPEDKQKAFVNYDIDECDHTLVSRYNIKGVPTLIVLNDRGEIVKRVSGNQTASTLNDLLTL